MMLPKEDSGRSCSAEVSTYCIAEKSSQGSRTSLSTPMDPSVSSTLFNKFPSDHFPPNLSRISSTSALCFNNVWCSPLPVRILHWQYFFTVKGDVRATRGMQTCVHGGVQGMENKPKSSSNNSFIQKMNKMGLQYC